MINETLQWQLAKKLMSLYETLEKYEVSEVCYMVFKNFTYTQDKVTGLRLTKLGYNLLKPQYDSHDFTVDEGIHKKLLLVLHKQMKWPYYLDKKKLVLFNDDDAMWLKMTGSVEKFAKGLE